MRSLRSELVSLVPAKLVKIIIDAEKPKLRKFNL